MTEEQTHSWKHLDMVPRDLRGLGSLDILPPAALDQLEAPP